MVDAFEVDVIDDRAHLRFRDAAAHEEPAVTLDAFLADQLKPGLLAEACTAAGIPLTLRMQPGYDHSYLFVSTFMADHVAWHAARLQEPSR